MRFSMSLETFMDCIIQFFLQTRGVGSVISRKVGSEPEFAIIIRGFCEGNQRETMTSFSTQTKNMDVGENFRSKIFSRENVLNQKMYLGST